MKVRHGVMKNTRSISLRGRAVVIIFLCFCFQIPRLPNAHTCNHQSAAVRCATSCAQVQEASNTCGHQRGPAAISGRLSAGAESSAQLQAVVRKWDLRIAAGTRGHQRAVVRCCGELCARCGDLQRRPTAISGDLQPSAGTIRHERGPTTISGQMCAGAGSWN